MSTAVVTITRGRDAHLHRQRVGLADDPPDRHVVVGMGARPELADVPGAPPVTVLEVDVPDSGLPLAAARNAGAAAADADLLVFLDVDCIPAPGMLRRYADAARRVDGPALLCGPVYYLPPAPDGGYPADGLAALAPPHPARPAPPDGELVAEERFDLFWSLSFAVTRATWAVLGGFCEDYTGYGGEDTDLACTAREAGVGLFWVGGASAFHQYHPPARETPGRIAEIVRNARLFHRRRGRWPMTGWLDDLAARGVVEFDPARGVLHLTPGGTP
ncbi:glycosyltransferase family 2 protein [Pseudonocardia hydrocarbonoxydans]|uniref:Glycosyl transferase family A n=1 Tax=Pseudonocardia hydrocarbonoxydans TaxID=76726 RepID=A0A4Y3WIY1_9PSEU|nr:glycosyltransferase [Pseudonocardia hydrocarbonoxydans]GEC18902.1 glycosyl transferase family A [Pseudonocardia hydrocarbonoxydans]